jgi:hypothetical protein
MPDSMEKLARDIRRMNKDQKSRMKNIKVMAAAYLDVLERELPDGRNKTWMIRQTISRRSCYSGRTGKGHDALRAR